MISLVFTSWIINMFLNIFDISQLTSQNSKEKWCEQELFMQNQKNISTYSFIA